MGPATIELTQIAAITFDCYGTLIDWEAGIRAYVAPHLQRASRGTVTIDAWFARWEEIQFSLLTPWRPYRDVLAESFDRTMRAFELEVFADGGPGLVHSLAEWRPFPDTVPALRRLGRGRRLGIISNIDHLLLADTLGQLAAPFSLLVTAEEARAYKPDPAPFRLALARIGVPPSSILHAAFGWKYDLAAARAVGMRTCFVNRSGGPRPAGEPPDLEVPSLAALAAAFAG
ncbi:MAG: haloacid dehalogenase type II [Myxococcales bacterium]|nr:haloacid dehalogenase type II [Myxococcales bacterium]